VRLGCLPRANDGGGSLGLEEEFALRMVNSVESVAERVDWMICAVPSFLWLYLDLQEAA
jgi:hypothetical protein